MSMKSITFVVVKEEGIYTASGIEETIITEASTLDTLLSNIEEAISLYYDNAPTPSPYTVVFSGVAQ